MSDIEQELPQPAEPMEAEVEQTEEASEQGEGQSESDGAGPAPAAHKVEFTPEQQAVFDKAIAEKTFKRREAEREAERLKAELEQVRAQLPKEQRPTIPPMPDPYDEDFNQRVFARDEALRKAAEWDARERFMQEQKAQQEYHRQLERQQALQKSVEGYSKRATSLGINAGDLAAAGQTIGAYGIDEALAEHILEHDKGPAITVFLAANPHELETLRAMNPIRAGVYLETVIAQRAAARHKTAAPPPPETLGTGGAPRTERGPKGARYE